MFLIFCDGENVLNKFKEKYITHKKGFFILAPSGSGKTHFVKNQKQNDWVDGDDLWVATGAEPLNDWWTQGLEVINDVDQKCDIITKEAKKNGFWVMGASNYWLIPDAIVLPDWRVNKKNIINREKTNYDGGAKSDAFQQVLNHRKSMKNLARKHKIPVFRSIKEATTFLEKLEKS